MAGGHSAGGGGDARIGGDTADSRIPWIAAALTAIAALVFAGLWLRRPLEEDATCVSWCRHRESYFGSGSGIAISPDGRHLAFAVERGNYRQLWVRDLDAAGARPVSGTDGHFASGRPVLVARQPARGSFPVAGVEIGSTFPGASR